MKRKFNNKSKLDKSCQESANANDAKTKSKSFNKKGSNSIPGEGKNAYHKNDISWYATDEQILKDVARIPYSIPVGYPMSRRGSINIGLQAAEFDNAIPGIAAMQIIPTVGNAQHANDAVNVAANGMYTFVRHTNSGSRNYDANDLIIYCMALDSVYYMISWATRAYATLSLYAQGNRYLPDALLRAQYIDPINLRSHMAQFRAGLNQRIRKIATLVVPAVLPIFARHSWMFSNYYIEGESIKDQIYLYYPATWYEFTKDSDEAGMLKAHHIFGSSTIGTASGHITAQDILDILDTMIDPIFADEDFNIISGDIYKAYGEGNLLKLALIPDELPIGVGFNEAVLLQFKNAKLCNVETENNSAQPPVLSRTYYGNMFDIKQSTGKSYIYVDRNPAAVGTYHDFDNSIRYAAKRTTSALDMAAVQAMWNEFSKPIMITSPHANVEPAENMISTRLTLAFDLEYDDTDESPYHTRVNEMYFGSEWPREVSYWAYHKDIATGTLNLFSRSFDSVKSLTPTNTVSAEQAVTSYLPIRSSFKYAPELTVVLNITEPDSEDILFEESGRSIFEVDNYTLIKSDVVSMLHNAAIQGEYNIPKVAISANK